MTGMILVKTIKEEELLLNLVYEFNNKVTITRSTKLDEVHKKYAKNGIYGIVGLEVDSDTNEAIFEVALPQHYLNFIDWMILQKRNE